MRRIALGIVILKKRSLVSTGSVFCKIIITPTMASMAMDIILKRFIADSPSCS
jgi:hypothetical protein